MSSAQPPRHARGFTLIELLVVIGILALIAAFVGPNLIGKADEANVKAAKVQIQKLSTAVDMYRLDNGKYPGDLQALLTQPADSPRWKGPYLKGGHLPKDPWDNDYVYRYPGEQDPYDILSLGADGQSGGEDYAADIGSWQ
jgi:general secretion pathway protein G